MKMLTLCLIAIAGILISASVLAAPKKGTVRHVVAFKFKDTASPEQIKQVEDAFRALKTNIPQIVSLEWGTNISAEKLDKGFTHCFLVTFKNEKDRDAYLVHPEHEKFKALVGPFVADVFVIDFLARN
jgi:hypothetical protein